MKTNECITASNNGDYWGCPCRNNTMSDGFDTCDSYGQYIEPVDFIWTGLYACLRCGRIVDQETLEVISKTNDISSFGINMINE